MTSIELQAFMSEPIDWREFEEVTLALLDDRGGDEHAAPYSRPRGAEETDTEADQGAKRPAKQAR